MILKNTCFATQILAYALFLNTICCFGSVGESDNKTPFCKSYISSTLDKENLIQEDTTPQLLLRQLLQLLDIEHGSTVQAINCAMQAHCIRKPGLERWDLGSLEQAKDTATKNKILQTIRQLGFVDAIPPTTVDVDYFLLFGARFQKMETRFEDFVQQYKAGTLRCNTIVLLGGIRSLPLQEVDFIRQKYPEFDSFLTRINTKSTELTETELWHFIWEIHATDAMKNEYQEGKQNLCFVHATDTNQSQNNRVTTNTTLEAWLSVYQPQGGKVHANVEKPYGIRMEKNLRCCLKQYCLASDEVLQFHISWNSSHADENTLLTVYMDEIARAFYQECVLKELL